jgi:hypothetical protein
MKKQKVMTVVGILLILAMTASLVSAAATYPDPGQSVTNIVVQNLATTAGEDATIMVEYYDTAGNLDYTRSGVTIAPKAVKEIKTQDEPLGDGWQGSAVMLSDRPLGAVVGVKNTLVPGAPDGMTQGAYNGAAAGANTLYFPSLFAFEHMVSRLTVQNTEGTAATIYMDYYDRDGVYLGQLSASIPAYSQRTFFLGEPTDVPFDPETFVDGAATVTSTNLLAGAAVTTWGNRSASYQALTPANQGSTLYAPSHYRFKVDPLSGVWTLFSALNLQNTSDTDVAHVTATYVSRATGAVALVKHFDIQPLSAAGLNTKNGGDFPASDFDALSYAGGGLADWDGSVEIVSSQPLVGISTTGWDSAGKAGAYALVTNNDAAASLFFPAQYRLDWGSGWAQWSAVNIMNVGGSPILAADLSIQYIDQNGNPLATFSGAALPFDLAAGGALGLNTRNGGDLGATQFDSLGLGFIGGVHVTAPPGSELVGVANIIYSNRASVYNAFPGQ